MKNFYVSELQLQEMQDLFEQGYHNAYTEDNGDYLTVCLTDDDGHKKEEEINDRFFDLEYSKIDVLIERLNSLEKEANKNLDGIPEEFESLEDSENYHYFTGALNVVKNIKELLGV